MKYLFLIYFFIFFPPIVQQVIAILGPFIPCIKNNCKSENYLEKEEEYFSEEEKIEPQGKCGNYEEFSEEMEINGKPFKRTKEPIHRGIANGALIYIGIDPGGECVAIKIINLEGLEPELEEEYLNEEKVFNKIGSQKNERIIRLYEFQRTENALIFVMEFGEENLEEYLARKFGHFAHDENENEEKKEEGEKSKRIVRGNEVRRARKVLHDVAKALEELHSHQIIYADLAPKNFVFVREGKTRKLKAIDFGISRILDEKLIKKECGWLKILPGFRQKYSKCISNIRFKTKRNPGSWAYMSREQFKFELSQKSDIWSFGVLAYFLLSRMEGDDKFPFAINFKFEEGEPPERIKSKYEYFLLQVHPNDSNLRCTFDASGVEEGNYRRIFTHLNLIVRPCLKKNPLERPDSISLLKYFEDAYFEGKLREKEFSKI